MNKKISNKLIKTISAGTLLAAPVAAVVSCGSQGQKMITSDETKKNGWKVGVTVWKADDPFMSVVKRGFYKGNEATGVPFSWQDAEGDQTKHNDKVDSLITSGVTALALNLVDPSAAAAVIKKAKDANLPLILYNKEASTADMATYDKVWYVGTRSRESGEMQVEDIAKSIKDGILKDVNANGTLGYFIINGEAAHADAMARTEAVREDLPKELAKSEYQEESGFNPQATNYSFFKTDSGSSVQASANDWVWAVNKTNKTVHIKNGASETDLAGIYKDLDDATGNNMVNTTDWSSSKGKEIAAPKITSLGNTLDFISANNDGKALGAVAAAKESQKKALKTKDATETYASSVETNYLPIFGVDNTKDAVASMKNGWLTGTVLNDGLNQGEIAMRMAVNSFKVGTTDSQIMTGITTTDFSYTNELNLSTKAIRVAYKPKYRGELDQFK